MLNDFAFVTWLAVLGRLYLSWLRSLPPLEHNEALRVAIRLGIVSFILWLSTCLLWPQQMAVLLGG